MNLQQILQQYWGYSSFRPLQEDIICSVLNGEDTLALLPTGGGKSICYQVPGLAKEGVCVVISPLIALMKDQVGQLRKRGIKAAAVFSGMGKTEIDIVLDNCIYGNYKFLYLSPERLGTEIVQARLEKMNVNLLAVDEAHCISQWGYDFRPSYLKIAEIRPLLHGAPLLALTATATATVKKDIQERLLFPQEHLFQASFERKNISYVVRTAEDKLNKTLTIFKKTKGTGIVYVRSRRRTQEIAEYLIRNGISADFYHAGMDMESRSTKQDQWLAGRFRVMVATNAFGMGIDKPDVRVVAHLDMPENVEAYYQEAGRAGRDGNRSYAVLVYNVSDKLEAEYRLEHHFPSAQEVVHIYNAIGNQFQLAIGSGLEESFSFDLNGFCKTFKLEPSKVGHALKILENQGLIAATEAVYLPSRIKFLASKEDLYRFQVEQAAYDTFVKYLLRSFGGLFDEFSPINELEIAKATNQSREEVMKKLRYLKSAGIIAYEAKSHQPRITFLQARAPERSLQLNKTHIEQRKALYEHNIKSMLGYAANKTLCRSRYLLNYFGETDNHRCGSCDICLELNKMGLSELEHETIQQEIKSLLASQGMDIRSLVQALPRFKEDKVLTVVRWLMEHNQIANQEGKLIWIGQ
ncbi:MAG: RecQ family ATP-dependent DNA helicase [Chitinophagales bacterium]|nr:RecQ family ATP-dependent DNA helicase [Chitinophagales bacterium]